MKKLVIATFAIAGFLLLISMNQAFAKIQDYRAPQASSELVKMQDFHLGQANKKIADGDYIHAWGDLAYLVCQLPNNHLALNKMLQISSKVNKNQELEQFISKAIKLYPQDKELLAIYQNFIQSRTQ